MLRKLALIIIALAMLTGCKPAGRMLTSVQYHNIDWRIAKSTMEMTTGDAGVDLRAPMEQECYVGKVTCGHVTVEYPQGLEQTAREIAQDFESFYPVVQESVGVEWSFDIVLKLVRVDPPAPGYRYSVVLPKNRKLTFPIPVTKSGPDEWWTPVIAHEVTEASMIAPYKRSSVVLDDIYSGDFCVSLGTRWLRDGLADYVEYAFESASYQRRGLQYSPPKQVYEDLNSARTALLDWSNCAGSPNMYSAASGLIFEMENRFGKDAIKKMMLELSKLKVPDGSGVRKAFRKTTGVDLAEFLTSYQTPTVGFYVRDTAPDSLRPNAIKPGNAVTVVGTIPKTPAAIHDMQCGDRIISFDSVQVKSAGQLQHLLARKSPWQIATIEMERGGVRRTMRVKLIPMAE